METSNTVPALRKIRLSRSMQTMHEAHEGCSACEGRNVSKGPVTHGLTKTAESRSEYLAKGDVRRWKITVRGIPDFRSGDPLVHIVLATQFATHLPLMNGPSYSISHLPARMSHRRKLATRRNQGSITYGKVRLLTMQGYLSKQILL